ncbi:MAG: TonB-dependent receptor [Muribaculaceae bacterium]|nr:TonB-dependent receptor [Muribaculaceae bacterium]
MMVALLMTLFSLPLSAQTIKITGTVVDSSDEPLTGATVMVKGTQDGASTDFDGKFTLSAPSDGVLVVSYIGYTTQEVKINGQQTIKVVLSENSTVLDEVVAVGYGTQKKVNMTGAVAAVDGKALEDRPITNVANALAGLAPGLAVTNTGGNTPGFESQTIRVRGTGTFNDSSPLVVVDGVTGINLSDVNPQDIESISVLKDAASSAIYGSRAANGVILITTKKGKEGQDPRLTYSMNLSFETAAKRLDFVTNYADYMELINLGRRNAGMADRFSQGKIDEWRNDNGAHPDVYPNNDWQDFIYRNPSTVQNHNLTVVGSSSNARYNLSAGYIHNPGLVYGSEYDRYQIRSNIEVDVKPWITVGMNTFAYIELNNPAADNNASGGDVIFGSGALMTPPGMTYYDKKTGLYGGMQNPEDVTGNQNYNPFRRNWFYDESERRRTRRIVPKLYARISPFKGLTITGSYTYNWWSRKEVYILQDKDLYRFMLDGDPIVCRDGTIDPYNRRYNTDTRMRNSDLIVEYTNKFFDNRLDGRIMAGTSNEYYRYEQEIYGLRYPTDPSLQDFSTAVYSTTMSTNGSKTEWAMRSWFGRLNLNWEDKYLLEFNLRADGSSRFSPENRWGIFPSVSAGWRMSQENFMKNIDWLNQLKVRASYGSLGNNAIGNYAWRALYSAAYYTLNGTKVAGLAQTSIANSNVSWETTYMTNFGIDFTALNTRLTGTIEVYNKDTKGILVALPAPLESGSSSKPAVNAGEVRNQGIDFNATWSDQIGKVGYTVGANFGYVKNKVMKFRGDVPSISGVFKSVEGKPINQLYVMQVDRIVRDQKDLDYVKSLVDKANNAAEPYNYFSNFTRPELGDFLYKDTNGDGKLDYDDRVEMGHGNAPTFTYGFNLGATWNNFDFQMLFNGIADYNVYWNNQAWRYVTVDGSQLNKTITDNAWTSQNPYNSKYPRLLNESDSRNQIASDAFVFNASYLRCKNLTVGYNIPANITKKMYLERLRLYTSIDNLFTISDFPGFDPELSAGVGYPTIRAYSVGIDIAF